MTERYVHLTPRLQTACELLKNARCVADIGCDHGRLSMALLQSGTCERVIATDISRSSLDKAKRLATVTGLSGRMDFRQGDGFSVIQEGQCDAAAILGMGGTLMARMLDANDPRGLGVTRLVLQPMRAFSDIRRYLHENRYHITDDRVICEGRRYYQVLCAVPAGTVQVMPDSWPAGFYELGFVSFLQGDSNLFRLARRMLAETERHLDTASGSDGEEKLRTKQRALLTICKEAEGIL